MLRRLFILLFITVYFNQNTFVLCVSLIKFHFLACVRFSYDSLKQFSSRQELYTILCLLCFSDGRSVCVESRALHLLQ